MGSDVRVIQRVDIPRMTFSYSLTDSSGEVLKSEDDFKLKDMGFMDTNIRNMRNENLFYEKAMLDDWFDDTFADTESLKNEG